jgi:hypothetical protein
MKAPLRITRNSINIELFALCILYKPFHALGLSTIAKKIAHAGDVLIDSQCGTQYRKMSRG